ncbi:MAG: hypothetical protein RLZZ406_737, partial [Pseudomonadota bacterium]
IVGIFISGELLLKIKVDALYDETSMALLGFNSRVFHSDFPSLNICQ